MMVWIWVALLAAFIIIEASTAQLLTIWFAVGSLAALISTFITDNIIVQVIVFVVVSAIALVITKTTKQPTNADMYIGKEAVVTEDINNLEAKGLVKVGGSIWTARTEVDNYTIPAGSHVIVIKIEGVKLIGRPILE